MISKRVWLTHHAAYCPLPAGGMGRESRWGGVPATRRLPWGVQVGVEAASGPGPRVASAARGCWRGWGLRWGSGCTCVSGRHRVPLLCVGRFEPLERECLSRTCKRSRHSRGAYPDLLIQWWFQVNFSPLLSLDRIFDVYRSFSSLWARDIFLS